MINTLSAYAAGNFSRNLKISQRYDELDAIAESINMVGQELKAVTISRNYFNNIFNSVSDMIFVLDRSGIIMDTNGKVYDQLGYLKESLLNRKLDALLDPEKDHLTKDILKGLKSREGRIYKDYYFKMAGGKLLPVRISASYLIGRNNRKNGILLIAEDRTSQIENENRVIRAIIDTQEEERRRLARDLHDGLEQELIGVKFIVSTLGDECRNKREKRALKQSDVALDQIICDMRDMCFNLLPKALEDFSLLDAVRELCLHTEPIHKIKFEINADKLFPELPKEVEIDLYRVIQEFITNALRHGQSSYIRMDFKSDKHKIFISLQDNGRGFSTDKVTGGMGLQNIESRIKSHKGEITLNSGYGKGTQFHIVLPVED
jgi:PAS domain S-box-containing protein